MNLPANHTVGWLNALSKDLVSSRVLLVDLNAGARNTLHTILSSLGIATIHNAASTAETLFQVKNHRFDIIFSDYYLGDGRDGQQLLEELRQQRLISLSTVYIIVTAERAYRNVISLAELTPDDYLIKPFTADQLQNRLIKALYKKRFFARVFAALDKLAFIDALAACEKLLDEKGLFQVDVLRFKGEILNILGYFKEALIVYQQVTAKTPVPWARMGLATALRGLGELDNAEQLALTLIEDVPEYMNAYDFVASVREEVGKLTEAQEILQQASLLSPNNSVRQRAVGDIAVRNHDLKAAERAYENVLERRRGSSLRVLDDYTNLTRVMLEQGQTEGVRRIVQDIRRDLRGNKQGELAASIVDSLCADHEGEPAKAKAALEKALSLHEKLKKDGAPLELSQKIAVDLAHACLASGEEERANEILSKIAAENHEDRNMIAQIQDVFTKTGREAAGQSMLAKVGKEIVAINNQGMLAARSGDLASSVEMLLEAAERVPNLQFLVNAAKAVFTQMDQAGWQEDLARRGINCLNLAQAKEPRNANLMSAGELYYRVARKYGIEVTPIGDTKRGSA